MILKFLLSTVLVIIVTAENAEWNDDKVNVMEKLMYLDKTIRVLDNAKDYFEHELSENQEQIDNLIQSDDLQEKQIKKLTNENQNLRLQVEQLSKLTVTETKINETTEGIYSAMDELNEDIEAKFIVMREGINECLTVPSPCNPNENCVDLPTGFECFSHCASNPCIHGQCLSQKGGFECNCEQGFTGQNCDEEINHCDSNPCSHGQCLKEIGSYQCTCEPNWYGKNCDSYNDCESNPNGRMVNGICYLFMAEHKNYDDANQYCKKQGARLFEPRSKTINKLVFDKSVEVFRGVGETWIGINDIATEGEFVFTSSGEKVSVFIWSIGYINGVFTFKDRKDCVLFGYNSDHNEKWYEKKCSWRNYFICEVV